MVIEKNHVDESLRRIRGLYRQHAEDTLNASGFVTKARAELNTLYMSHTRERVDATATHFIEEIKSFQTQFGLDLDCSKVRLFRVNRGYRGIRGNIEIRTKVSASSFGYVEVFIGPFDEWNRVAVHTVTEWKNGRPSFYTKRREKRWQYIQEFNFPDLLQRIKEEAEKPELEGLEDDEVAF